MGRFYELYPGGWQGAVLERVMLGRWISGDMTAAKGRAWSQVRLGGKVSLRILPIQRETEATVHFMGLRADFITGSSCMVICLWEGSKKQQDLGPQVWERKNTVGLGEVVRIQV